LKSQTVVEPHVSLDIQHLAFGRIPDAMAVEQKVFHMFSEGDIGGSRTPQYHKKWSTHHIFL